MMSADQNLFYLCNADEFTDAEKKKLSEVMKKAKEFEQQEGRELMRQPLEGVLFKYTNMVKGFQFRWFVLDPDFGKLDYFEKEEYKNQKARGSIPLQGATIYPSEEDSQTFAVCANNGEIYKLRATDARERQLWVNRLRATAESLPREGSVSKSSTEGSHASVSGPSTTHHQHPRKNQTDSGLISSQFEEVQDLIHQCQQHHQLLSRRIENLPRGSDDACCLDRHLLQMKATSSVTVKSLYQCLSVLIRTRPSIPSRQSTPLLGAGDRPSECSIATEAFPEDENDYEQDTELYCDQDVGDLEDQKPLILQLLSQLKLGMDLTKVVLPTVILERRSLLEMLADCMAHPKMFLEMNKKETPQDRMLALWEWYMASFHAGRQDSVAKKPYNPVIGETFHCWWEVPQEDCSKGVKLWYQAEQVSHHPPVSAFYFECPDQRMCMNASIYTRSRFLGMSIGVEMVGKLSLHLLAHNETYEFTLPSAYARSILTVPWVELGGKVTMNCPQSGYTATVNFHTTPFYGGKVHRITGEVLNPQSEVVCNATGEWNSAIQLQMINGGEKTLNVKSLPVVYKRVKRHQAEYESRKLWRHVTEALAVGDIERATDCKRFLEEQQRISEKLRREQGQKYCPRYFTEESEGSWVYSHMISQ